MNKKLVSILLGTAVLAGNSIPTFALTDLDNHWSKDAVNQLIEEKVINGYNDGTFKPENYITREEVAKITDVYFDKLIIDQGISTNFNDLEESWSTEHIKRLVSAGIINGYEDNTFKAGNEIKRGEVAKIVHTALENCGKYENRDLKVELNDIDGHWAKPHIQALVEMGVIKGNPDGSFKPDDSIKRAEVASIFKEIGIDLNEREKDIIEPAISEVEPITENDIGIKGKGSTGHNVRVVLADKTILEEAIEEDGSWTILMNEKVLKEGDKIYISTIDSNNVESRKLLITVRKREGGDFIYTVSGDGLGIYGYIGTEKDIKIPKTIYGQPVVEIGDEAFYDSELTSVEIPDTVKTIGENAFRNNKLSKVVIPGSVKSIGMNAFLNNGIKELNLSNSVETIGVGAFEFNKLTSLKLPDSINSIESYAFSKNELKSLDMGNSVKILGDGTFSYNMLTEVVLPKSIDRVVLNEGYSNIEKDSTGIDMLKTHKVFDESVYLSWK